MCIRDRFGIVDGFASGSCGFIVGSRLECRLGRIGGYALSPAVFIDGWGGFRTLGKKDAFTLLLGSSIES